MCYELMEKYISDNRMTCMEGNRGVRNLTKLVKDVGGYRSLDEFFEDNSGAIDAIVEWMTTVNSPEWKANLEQLVEFDDEEVEDDDERDE